MYRITLANYNYFRGYTNNLNAETPNYDIVRSWLCLHEITARSLFKYIMRVIIILGIIIKQITNSLK